MTSPPHPSIAAILLCAGEGSRIRLQGVNTHKPLLELNNTPSIKFIINNLLDCSLSFDQILVIVPPLRVMDYEKALDGLSIEILIQELPLGTGDAVLCACEKLEEAIEHVYVSFGTQPLIRNNTITTSFNHHITNDLSFTLPTTIRDNPYAPLLRNKQGSVTGSVETHLEKADMPKKGETNVGAYWAKKEAINTTLRQIADKLKDSNGNYITDSGEFGYPNEMVRACLSAGLGVDGIICAEPKEVVGIKTLETLKIIEDELSNRNQS